MKIIQSLENIKTTTIEVRQSALHPTGPRRPQTKNIKIKMISFILPKLTQLRNKCIKKMNYYRLKPLPPTSLRVEAISRYITRNENPITHT